MVSKKKRVVHITVEVANGGPLQRRAMCADLLPASRKWLRANLGDDIGKNNWCLRCLSNNRKNWGDE